MNRRSPKSLFHSIVLRLLVVFLTAHVPKDQNFVDSKIFIGILLTLFLFNFGASVSGVFLPHFVRMKFGASVLGAQTISCISMLGAGDLCGRLMSGVLGNWLPISKLLMVFIDTLLLGITTILIPFCPSYSLVLVCTFVAGFGTGRYLEVFPIPSVLGQLN